MDLEEFVKTTLHQIINAVNAVDIESDAAIHGVSLVRSASEGSVEFDLAVSAEKTGSSSKKAGIKVLEVIQGGADTSSETKYSSVSRIKFKVNA